MKNNNLLLLLLIVLLGAFLRFNQLDKIPHGLYIDEVSIGYNAYQILTTGHDEHGVAFPLFFKAFGEYKLPVYIYLTSGAMALFGKEEFAIRFASALFGSLTLLVMFFFSKELLLKIKNFPAQNVALLSMFLLAISSWHIHFSRGGFEATVALFFYLLGSLLALKFMTNKKILFFVFGALCLVVSVYTYSTYKFIALLTMGALIAVYIKRIAPMRKQIIYTGVAFLILSLPMILFSFTSGGSARFNETSAFTEYPTKTFLDQIILYPQVFLKNYLTFFSLDFFFSNGDGIGRHQIPGMGILYKWQLPFLLLGLFWLLKQKNTYLKLVIIGLLLLAPLAPAVARPSPNSLRSLLMVIPLMFLVSCGVVYLYSIFKKLKIVVTLGLLLVAGYTFTTYMHMYYTHYPSVNALDWGGAYKETFQRIEARKEGYSYVVIDANFLFAKAYANYYAPSLKALYQQPNWGELKKMDGKVLFVTINYPNRNDAKLLEEVYLPGPNKTVYAKFWEL